MPAKDEQAGKCYFVIRYIQEKNAYAIKDMGDGSGTFLKISYKCILKDNSTICFGDIHFTVSFPNLSYILELI